MADRKISDLTALTTPATGDLLPIVDVSEVAAADKNKKITVQELFKGVPDGTASAPGLAFESDDGNGIYLAGTDTVGIATGGAQRVTVNASGDVAISGNLTVSGTTTTIDSTTLTVDDKNIELGSVASPSDTTADGGGITLLGATNKTLTWVQSTGMWTSNQPFDVAGEVQCDSLDVDGAADITGNLTLHADLDLQDNDKILLGTGDDLEIEHTGSGSFIRTSTSATGDLAIEARNGGDLYLTGADDVIIRPQGGESGINVIGDGAVELYHDNSKKFDTVSGGARIYGYLSMQGSGGHVYLPDSAELKLGNSEDLKIYHDGSHNYIYGADGQNIYINAGDHVVIRNGTTNETSAKFLENGKVELRYDDAIKFETTSTGIQITGSGGNSDNDTNSELGFNNSTYGVTAKIRHLTGVGGVQSGKGQLAFFVDNGSTLTERLRINEDGNVGVGVTSPGVKFHVSGTNDASIRVANTLNNTPSGNHLELLNNSSDGLKFNVGRSGIGGNSSLTYDNNFNINAGATGVATFDSSGRLLVGTSSDSNAPSDCKFVVSQSEDVRFLTQSYGIKLIRSNVPGNGAGIGRLMFIARDSGSNEVVGANIAADTDGAWSSGNCPGRLSFQTTAGSSSSPTERMRIDSTGHVMLLNNTATVGTGSSSGQLQIYGGASLRGGEINLYGGSNGGVILFRAGTSSGQSSERARIDASGRLLVGTTSSSAATRLVVQGNSSSSSGTGSIYLRRGNDAIGSGVNLGEIVFTNNANQTGAYIQSTSDAAWSLGSSHPTRINFATTAASSTSPTERLHIASTGAFGLSGANYGSSGQVLTSNGSGSAPSWQDAGGGSGAGTVEAWVTFNGTGSTPSIRASGNCSSITDLGTGLWRFNFTNNLTDSNYAVTGSATPNSQPDNTLWRLYGNSGYPTGAGDFDAPATSNFEFSTTRSDGTVFYDAQYINCIVVR